jgi:hypothetical protein
MDEGRSLAAMLTLVPCPVAPAGPPRRTAAGR